LNVEAPPLPAFGSTLSSISNGGEGRGEEVLRFMERAGEEALF
jgi:hypothetical protein